MRLTPRGAARRRKAPERGRRDGGARSPHGPWRGGGRGAWMGAPTIGAARRRKAPQGASASVMLKYAANDILKGTLYSTIGAPAVLASPMVFLHAGLI